MISFRLFIVVYPPHRKYLFFFACSTEKAKNTKAARALLDLKDAKLDEKGEVVGLSEKIKELQKSDAYLFDAVGKQKKEVDGIHPGSGSDGGDAAKLTVQQQFEQALGI